MVAPGSVQAQVVLESAPGAVATDVPGVVGADGRTLVVGPDRVTLSWRPTADG
jgi:hypothetical protein